MAVVPPSPWPCLTCLAMLTAPLCHSHLLHYSHGRLVAHLLDLLLTWHTCAPHAPHLTHTREVPLTTPSASDYPPAIGDTCDISARHPLPSPVILAARS
jgi:hypothetical protein